MNATEAITKIKLLLGLENEVTETFAVASLVDGTQVEVEGEFEVGKSCFVVADEEKIQAPAGVHQTADNMLITIDEAGVITEISEFEEEVKEEEVVEAEDVKEEVEVEMEEESKDEEEVSMEDAPKEEEEQLSEEEVVTIAQEVVAVLKPYIDNLDELKEKVAEMEAKFETFAKAPAARPVKKVSEDFEANKIDRVAKIAKLRK